MDKRIGAINQPDIQGLVDNAVSEARTLDYKEKLPGNTDGAKKEFLSDVASFANASGGYIFFGLEEKRDADGQPTGEPDRVVPLANLNVDKEMLRLEQLIRDGISPRIQGVQIRDIPGFQHGHVLAIHIPQSWSAPHMVIYKSPSRFYSRNSRGKYPLDISEIRTAFALTQSARDSVAAFRNDRLGQIVANGTPVLLQDNPKVILHVVPVSGLTSFGQLDIAATEERVRALAPLYGGGWNSRFNFDGILHFIPTADGSPSPGYMQLFRNGSIEAVDARLLARMDERKTIPSTALEGRLVRGLESYLAALRELDIQPPIVAMVSLLDVQGYQMAVAEGGFRDSSAIDRESLLLPDILIEEYEVSIGTVLRPAFDALWQACGYPGSRNYDADGRWIEPH
jgi:hypothetical protein